MRKSSLWRFLIGMLTLLGISWTGAQLKNKKYAKIKQKHLSGTWTIHSKTETNKKELKITKDGVIFIDHRKIDGKIIQSSEEYLLYHDHFGYRLELFENSDGQLTFYDEAGDKYYLAEKL